MDVYEHLKLIVLITTRLTTLNGGHLIWDWIYWTQIQIDRIQIWWFVPCRFIILGWEVGASVQIFKKRDWGRYVTVFCVNRQQESIVCLQFILFPYYITSACIFYIIGNMQKRIFITFSVFCSLMSLMQLYLRTL
jgi:hypothetical protein